MKKKLPYVLVQVQPDLKLLWAFHKVKQIMYLYHSLQKNYFNIIHFQRNKQHNQWL